MTDLGSSENTKINAKKQARKQKQHLGISYSKCRKSKIKEKTLKEARRGESLNYKGAKIRITSDFSSETMQTREWCETFKVLREKKQPRILHTAKLSCKSERQRLSQTNKNWGNLLPVGLPCKKCEKFFREKENETGQKHGFTLKRASENESVKVKLNFDFFNS